MSVFESRTKMDEQKASPNSPVTVPVKGNSSPAYYSKQHSSVSQMQQLSDASPRVMQLKALSKMADNSPLIQLRSQNQVIQLASTIDWTSQQFSYHDAADGELKTEEVGYRMTAHLEPGNPIKGADADTALSAKLYQSLNYFWEPGSKHWVRGHVLNHDLGGPNTKPNIFPITGHANGDHSNYVEEHVKSALHRGKTVDYTVTATQEDGTTEHRSGKNIRNAGGTFDCVATWNESAGVPRRISRTITSSPKLKTRPGLGKGIRRNHAFNETLYDATDTVAVRDADGDVTGGGEVPNYAIPDGWQHGEMDAAARTQWMADNRVGDSEDTYRQTSG